MKSGKDGGRPIKISPSWSGRVWWQALVWWLRLQLGLTGTYVSPEGWQTVAAAKRAASPEGQAAEATVKQFEDGAEGSARPKAPTSIDIEAEVEAARRQQVIDAGRGWILIPLREWVTGWFVTKGASGQEANPTDIWAQDVGRVAGSGCLILALFCCVSSMILGQLTSSWNTQFMLAAFSIMTPLGFFVLLPGRARKHASNESGKIGVSVLESAIGAGICCSLSLCLLLFSSHDGIVVVKEGKAFLVEPRELYPTTAVFRCDRILSVTPQCCKETRGQLANSGHTNEVLRSAEVTEVTTRTAKGSLEVRIRILLPLRYTAEGVTEALRLEPHGYTFVDGLVSAHMRTNARLRAWTLACAQEYLKTAPHPSEDPGNWVQYPGAVVASLWETGLEKYLAEKLPLLAPNQDMPFGHTDPSMIAVPDSTKLQILAVDCTEKTPVCAHGGDAGHANGVCPDQQQEKERLDRNKDKYGHAAQLTVGNGQPTAPAFVPTEPHVDASGRLVPGDGAMSITRYGEIVWIGGCPYLMANMRSPLPQELDTEAAKRRMEEGRRKFMALRTNSLALDAFDKSGYLTDEADARVEVGDVLPVGPRGPSTSFPRSFATSALTLPTGWWVPERITLFATGLKTLVEKGEIGVDDAKQLVELRMMHTYPSGVRAYLKRMVAERRIRPAIAQTLLEE